MCDYVPGENLEQLVTARGRLAEKDARQLSSSSVRPWGALHEHGIVHRDVSPTNVIVAADGAHLIDLGIARFRVEGATRDTTQLGTYGFASPEQYGFAQTDARSDVYSLGRMLGYLLTGVSPAEAEKYEAALADTAVVSPAMRELVARATAMEPSARYQTVTALAAALNGEKGPEPAASVPETPRTAEPDIQLRDYRHYLNPTKILVAFMALAAFAVAVVLILFNEGDCRRREERRRPRRARVRPPQASQPRARMGPRARVRPRLRTTRRPTVPHPASRPSRAPPNSRSSSPAGPSTRRGSCTTGLLSAIPETHQSSFPRTPSRVATRRATSSSPGTTLSHP